MKKQLIIGIVLMCVVLPLMINLINKQFKFEGMKEATLLSVRTNEAGERMFEVSVYLHDQFQSRRYIGYYSGNDAKLLSLLPDVSDKYQTIPSEPKVKIHYSGNAILCTNCVTIDSMATE